MAYDNVEQIFIDVLGGRSPSPKEQVEIDNLLAIVKRAGFIVNDPSNAAHITMLAWSWARETGRSDVLTTLHNSRKDNNDSLSALRQDMVQWQSIVVRELSNRPQPTAYIDMDAMVTAIRQSLPQSITTVKIDMTVLKEAIKESVSLLWLMLAGIGLAVSFWGGIAWKQHQLKPVIGQWQIQNQQLQSQNQRLINKLSAIQHAR